MISHVFHHDHKKEPKIKIRVIVIAVLIVLVMASIIFNFTIGKDNKTSQATSQNSNPSPTTSTSQAPTPLQTTTTTPSPQPTTPSVPTPVQQTPPPAPTPVPAPAPKPVDATISTSELQSIMQNFPQVMSIKDPKIKMQFHDNNSLYLGYTYFISSGGQVSQYSGQESDMWLTINVYDALALKDQSNKCASLKSVIQSGKAWVIEQSSNPFVIMKYMSIKSCVM